METVKLTQAPDVPTSTMEKSKRERCCRLCKDRKDEVCSYDGERCDEKARIRNRVCALSNWGVPFDLLTPEKQEEYRDNYERLKRGEPHPDDKKKARADHYATARKVSLILYDDVLRARISGACLEKGCPFFSWTQQGSAPSCKRVSGCNNCARRMSDPRWSCPEGHFGPDIGEPAEGFYPEFQPLYRWDEATGGLRSIRAAKLFEGRDVILVGTSPNMPDSRDRIAAARENCLVMAMNHSAHYLVDDPDMWIMVDDWGQQDTERAKPTPGRESLWNWRDVSNPDIQKVTSMTRRHSKANGQKLHELGDKVWYFRWEYGSWPPIAPSPSFWSGIRLTTSLSLQILLYLGVRRIFMVGHEMHCQGGIHCYDDGKDPAMIPKKDHRFQNLLSVVRAWAPTFEKMGTKIVNSTPDSAMAPAMPFEELPQ